MARKRKIYEDIKITGIADKGKGVGRDSMGIVYFVAGAVPGDIVDVKVYKSRKSYREGIIEAIKTFSPDRIEPFCEHFENCGGCKWQNLTYETQLLHKQNQVYDNLERIGHLDIQDKRPILGSDQTREYRNKMEYTFAHRRWVPSEELSNQDEVDFGRAVGFHRSGSFDKVIQVEKCHLQNDIGNRIRNFLHALSLKSEFSYYNAREHTGFMRNLRIRNSTLGEWMIIVIFGENNPSDIKLVMDELVDNFPEINSLYYVVNTKKNDTINDLPLEHVHGNMYLTERLGHIEYKVSPKSFFQTNTYQAVKLYDQIVELADLKGDEVVYDLYTGLGSIALYVADKCHKVVGIEEIEDAIEDAIMNRDINGITNAEFEVGDVKNVFNEGFIDRHGSPDLIIVDPPRAGLHMDVIKTIAESGVERIIYVSCNPATQARDLNFIRDIYDVKVSQSVDMFPHTHHIENIVLLEKNSASA